jgi:hypothetical protein
MRVLLTAVLTLCYAAAVHAAPLRAAEVLAVADSRGDRAALELFFDCGPAGTAAYDRVASGSAEWLAVAVRLLNGSDACYSLLLHDSIARALVHNPRGVLALVNTSSRLTAEGICLPFMSAEEDPKMHLLYLRRAESALRSVKAASLQAPKQACMQEVESMRKALQLASNPSLQPTASGGG